MASRALNVPKPTPKIQRLESVPLNSPQCHDLLIDYPPSGPHTRTTHDLHPGVILLDLTRVYDAY